MITYLNLNITLPNSLWIWLDARLVEGPKICGGVGRGAVKVKKLYIASIKAKKPMTPLATLFPPVLR